MDLTRLAEALLGGAATPPRRRRRRAAPSLLGSSRSREAQAVRGLATLAGIAIEALSKSRPTPQPVPAPTRRAPDLPPPRVETTPKANPWNARAPEPAPEPGPPAVEDAEALLLIRAMIAAAVADGHVEPAERQAIAAQLDAAGLDVRERDFVLADFERPLTPEALAREAKDPMLAAQLYAASVAAVGEISDGERAFLDRLAKALRLDKAAVAAIEQRLGAA
jgi:uncharacterized membrane protein YebE (DUF533 family)